MSKCSMTLTFAGMKKNAMFFERKEPVSSSCAGFTSREMSSRSSMSIARMLPGKANGSTAEIMSPMMQMPKTIAICKSIFMCIVYNKRGGYSNGTTAQSL